MLCYNITHQPFFAYVCKPNKKNKRLTNTLVCVIVLVHNALEEHTMQTTVTQAQALQHCAQQLVYVTDSANKHTYCLDTAEEIIAVLQQLITANANFASIVAATRYSNDEVNEEKYL